METLFFYWLLSTASPLPPARECVVRNERKECVLWYDRLTGEYYDSNGQKTTPPWSM
jgi:hypothetical protein